MEDKLHHPFIKYPMDTSASKHRESLYPNEEIELSTTSSPELHALILLLDCEMGSTDNKLAYAICCYHNVTSMNVVKQRLVSKEVKDYCFRLPLQLMDTFMIYIGSDICK